MGQEIESRVTRLLGNQPEEVIQQFLRVCRLSDYVRHSVLRHGDIVGELIVSGGLTETYKTGVLKTSVRSLIDLSVHVEAFDLALRRVRRREMVRIIFRDVSRRSDLAETTNDLSELADASISLCLEYHFQASCRRYGVPSSVDGKQQEMCILALGKLGARELNLSSDVDLIFMYDKQGFALSTSGMKTSNQEFFLRVSRLLIASLNVTTADGFVFRVDMRLRPYGESSALILHRAALEKYFVEQGRDWERYAFIKARAVTGNISLGNDFLGWLKPFVYRKHLDYGAIESLREMKRLIDRQVELKDLGDDLKLGAGGIREIEFIAQAHQLIFGGNNPRLQEGRLQTVMKVMREDGYLPAEDVQGLLAAYVFLRNSEHAIQAENDQQTQLLPVSELSRSRLAEVMGFSDWQEYLCALDLHRNTVAGCFSRLMGANQVEMENLVEGNLIWVNIWLEPDSPQAGELLSKAGFTEPEAVGRQLAELLFRVSELQQIGQERVGKLMPALLGLTARQQDPDTTLTRLLPVLESVLRRSTYLAYLLENADALRQMVDLCAMSPWVAAQLGEHPILLYELSGINNDEVSIGRPELERQLNNMMMVLDEDDLESQMDTLRQFKNAATLRIAIFELLDLLPVMKASDSLTVVAELVLQKSLELSLHQLVRKHGQPPGSGAGSEHGKFAIIAYGKLGGIELAYGSDLDLVFLFDGEIHGNTDGNKPINNHMFFSRLAQRLIHILSMYTRFGVLYEVDMRLRPSGNKGPMVSSINAFERYLCNDAWTWEHQALVRARFVAGDCSLGEQFTEVRRQVLSMVRKQQGLKQDVLGMREKMREHLSRTNTSGGAGDNVSPLPGFDLKHDIGAIVDIEFMVQYAVLAWACKNEELVRWTDKMRLLDELEKLALFSTDEIRLLQKAYLAFRSVVHYQWLGGELSSFSQLQEYRKGVISIWQKYMTVQPPIRLK
jgi:[glutamine synthetase] adenylyltransferase / [glutamine synthetase]-adenylyl-L-tyrosine phosphorylase